MNEKNSVKKTFENNDAALEFISLSENVIICLYWWNFNSVDIIFPICASFCRTNQDDEERGQNYTVGQKIVLDEVIVLDD